MSAELTQSAVLHSKDVLVADLKRVVSDADALMKEVVNSTSEELSATRQRIEARLGEARARIDDARIVAKRKVSSAADSTQAFVSENPWTVIGVATAVSVIATYLLIGCSGKPRND